MDSVSAVVTDLLPYLRQGLENLVFEVTEGRDDQIVFSNGLRDSQGVLAIDFEINAVLMVHSSPSSGDGDSDVDMIHSDRGYEEDLEETVIRQMKNSWGTTTSQMNVPCSY